VTPAQPRVRTKLVVRATQTKMLFVFVLMDSCICD